MFKRLLVLSIGKWPDLSGAEKDPKRVANLKMIARSTLSRMFAVF
jgi:hypothetical protein